MPKEVRKVLIDFHTHIFPDRIAPGAVESLKNGVRRIEGIYPPNYTDATYEGLIKSMYEQNVDLSIAMPIATNPQKPDSINEFAKGIRNNNIISFGSVHPEQTDAVEWVYKLKEMGFMGLKLHPEFQYSFIDSKDSIEVLKTAEKAGLLVMLHAGADIGMPPPVHCTPKRLKNALEYVKGDNIIAAHLGGWRMWDEVEEHLVGTPIYMDTAYVLLDIKKEQCRRIIKNHGEDKILFGSDSPWETPLHTLEFIESLGLDSEIVEKIKYKNAKKLLEKYK